MQTGFNNEEALDAALSEPTAPVVEWARTLGGDLVILGAGGKMGPTLAAMAREAVARAAGKSRIICVSRFSDPGERKLFEDRGLETRAGDLLDPAFLESLPDAAGVVFMAGMKFGASHNAPQTWATNVVLPAMACRRYAGIPTAFFSTGNVYGLVSPLSGGSREDDTLNPAGEYAMSCLGRERIFEHAALAWGTPVASLRLNYACELRYGVLTDIALKVWHGEPVELEMGLVNVIWQADANAMALLALSESANPARVLNIAGPETLSVRRIALQFGHLMGKPVTFAGRERETALLSNAQAAHQAFGYPRVNPAQMISWVADWIKRGGRLLDKPTRFQVRDGAF